MATSHNTDVATRVAPVRERKTEKITPPEHFEGVDELQRTIGNRATVGLLNRGQAKLKVGASNDRYEQEADDVASQVVRALSGRAPATDGPAAATVDHGVQRQAIQRRAVVDERGGDLDTATETLIQNARSGGQSLAPTIRRTMEGAIGADFSGVKVHTGAASDALNDSIQASAFTVGNDIFFHGGAPDTSSAAGQELMAHELTHTIQQGAAVQRTTAVGTISVAGDAVSSDAGATIQRRGKRKPKGGGPAPVVPEVVEEEEVEDEVEEVVPEKEVGPTPESIKKAEDEAAAKLAAEQQAAAVAQAKATYLGRSGATMALRMKARTDATPFPRIDQTIMEGFVDEIRVLDSTQAPEKPWLEMAALLPKIWNEAARLINLAALAVKGQLAWDGSTIPVQKMATVKGDKDKNEVAAVKEAVDAINGKGTWCGTNGFGDVGKWGVSYGDREGYLPAGGTFLEYYVRAETGNRKFGARRIVKDTTSGRIYYSSTHYGEQGDPPFILLTT